MSIDYSLDQTPINRVLKRKYACDDEWTKAFLIRCQVGHIATHWDDQPFITPVLYWYDPDKNKIYFHTATKGRLLANIKRDNKVCFEASEIGEIFASKRACDFCMQYESAIVFGKMHLVEDREEQNYALYGLIKKHFPDMEVGVDFEPVNDDELAKTSVLAISIESWSGKRNWREKAG